MNLVQSQYISASVIVFFPGAARCHTSIPRVQCGGAPSRFEGICLVSTSVFELWLPLMLLATGFAEGIVDFEARQCKTKCPRARAVSRMPSTALSGLSNLRQSDRAMRASTWRSSRLCMMEATGTSLTRGKQSFTTTSRCGLRVEFNLLRCST